LVERRRRGGAWTDGGMDGYDVENGKGSGEERKAREVWSYRHEMELEARRAWCETVASRCWMDSGSLSSRLLSGARRDLVGMQTRRLSLVGEGEGKGTSSPP